MPGPCQTGGWNGPARPEMWHNRLHNVNFAQDFAHRTLQAQSLRLPEGGTASGAFEWEW